MLTDASSNPPRVTPIASITPANMAEPEMARMLNRRHIRLRPFLGISDSSRPRTPATQLLVACRTTSATADRRGERNGDQARRQREGRPRQGGAALRCRTIHAVGTSRNPAAVRFLRHHIGACGYGVFDFFWYERCSAHLGAKHRVWAVFFLPILVTCG